MLANSRENDSPARIQPVSRGESPCWRKIKVAVRSLEHSGTSRSHAKAMVGRKTESIYRRHAITDARSQREAGAKLGAVSEPVGERAFRRGRCLRGEKFFTKSLKKSTRME
jgi:hypothetical protein